MATVENLPLLHFYAISIYTFWFFGNTELIWISLKNWKENKSLNTRKEALSVLEAVLFFMSRLDKIESVIFAYKWSRLKKKKKKKKKKHWLP